jgi:hypothetical protein
MCTVAAVSNCFAKGDVRGREILGGLIGLASFSTIHASYATGNVSWWENVPCDVGGLVGRAETVDILDCYARGNVFGERNVGGLVGYAWAGRTERCYAMGRVSGKESVGGLLGLEERSTYDSCFWDMSTSGQTTGANPKYASPHVKVVSGRCTADMQTAQPFLDAGWDLQNVWTICEGKDYPRLRWEWTTCP